MIAATSTVASKRTASLSYRAVTQPAPYACQAPVSTWTLCSRDLARTSSGQRTGWCRTQRARQGRPGIDLADADPVTVHPHVGLVPQDYTRWPLDARSNVHLGQPRAGGGSAIHAAAQASGADAVIAQLPQGLDTSLARS
ncbi:hypothetical protein ACFVU3_28600 [Streptomyces sp. NPDC058052]|uniref:hypothetical protein n=1 Tax=Streptomyces sp. NPDC058052 TaxID=3346316 RepID=UPI0036E11084